MDCQLSLTYPTKMHLDRRDCLSWPMVLLRLYSRIYVVFCCTTNKTFDTLGCTSVTRSNDAVQILFCCQRPSLLNGSLKQYNNLSSVGNFLLSTTLKESLWSFGAFELCKIMIVVKTVFQVFWWLLIQWKCWVKTGLRNAWFNNLLGGVWWLSSLGLY